MVSTTTYKTGISVVWADGNDTDAFCQTIKKHLAGNSYAIAFIYYSAEQHNPHRLVELLGHYAPELKYSGCSTCGEVTPGGVQHVGALAILLPANKFRAHNTTIENVDAVGMHAIAQQATEQRMLFETSVGVSSLDNTFALTLIDGLTYAEDAVTSALFRGLGSSIPLIGASAGDNLAFEGTTQICNGRVYSKSAILNLIQCDLPFKLYTENNFVPTSEKLVVTESDPELRKVREFNAEPAAEAYARAIGLTVEELTPLVFASNALVVKVGGEYHCRAIQKLNNDNSLTFFSAIDNGVVLTVAKSEGMVRSTQQAIERIEHSVGKIDMMMGFECIYRELDAQHRNVMERIEDVYLRNKFSGFYSYGEQFQSMHINQTFTGVAFGLQAN